MMIYRNRYCRKCCNKRPNNNNILNKTTDRTIFNINNKWRVMQNKKCKKYTEIKKQVNPGEYVFYSILNTDIAMDFGETVSTITRSIMALYKELKTDSVKNMYIYEWQKTGENIIILKGYDHKHLMYLRRESMIAALGTHAICQRWYRNRVMLALSVFGYKENIEDIFEGLSYLRWQKS